MHPHESDIRTNSAVFFSLMLLLLLAASGCGSKEKGNNVREVPIEDSEFYHADNDIAMTVRSLMDALKVGEPLDSAFYDYEGILTDGQGSPLYTDVQGAPGIWVVDVLDNKSVMIRNLFLGDLLPLDLQSYILQSLDASGYDKMDFAVHEAVDDEETEIDVYDLDGIYLRFEVRAGIAPNGIEGPLLNIIMSSDPPSGAETQTSV